MSPYALAYKTIYDTDVYSENININSESDIIDIISKKSTLVINKGEFLLSDVEEKICADYKDSKFTDLYPCVYIKEVTEEGPKYIAYLSSLLPTSDIPVFTYNKDKNEITLDIFKINSERLLK